VPSLPPGFTEAVAFHAVNWNSVPEEAGVYAIYDRDELLYVGMAGRDGKGSLRRRLKDHSSGQVVNMFAQYLFFARAQFLAEERVTHPARAKELCQRYMNEWCLVSWRVCASAAEARELENSLKQSHRPALNGTAQSAA
jgi:excinuclease UvrABC nuclease subunit